MNTRTRGKPAASTLRCQKPQRSQEHSSSRLQARCRSSWTRLNKEEKKSVRGGRIVWKSAGTSICSSMFGLTAHYSAVPCSWLPPLVPHANRLLVSGRQKSGYVGADPLPHSTPALITIWEKREKQKNESVVFFPAEKHAFYALSVLPTSFWRFVCTFLTQIDCKCEYRKKRLASQEAKLVPLDMSWLPLSENPDHHPQKMNRSAKRCVWRYRL
jgi:hypothetical protein